MAQLFRKLRNSSQMRDSPPYDVMRLQGLVTCRALIFETSSVVEPRLPLHHTFTSRHVHEEAETNLELTEQ